MSQSDALKRYLEAGMAFTQLTRKRAEQLAVSYTHLTLPTKRIV